MEIQSIIDVVLNQGIWCVLFCYIFFDTQKKANEREDKLYIQLDNYNKALQANNEKLQEMTITLDNINNRIDRIEEKR